MTETPYIVQVDERGKQRLCLSDGTPIPVQVESVSVQNTEHAMFGVCSYTVLIYIDKPGYVCATGAVSVVDDHAIRLPDGRICDVDIVVENSDTESPSAYITVTAKMIQTVEISGICNNVNIGADADNA